MPRVADAPSRMEILLLTSLMRAPMHGYELKLELAYKHVEWWAKCEHGHVYAALARLEKNKHIKQVNRAGGRSNQKVFAVTAAGRKRLATALETLGRAPDATYFDIDMFLSACHVLTREQALAILETRRDQERERAREAAELVRAMKPHVPAVGMLIMEHRIEYMKAELEFLERCLATLRAQRTWGPFLGQQTIQDFVKKSQVPLEKVKS